MSAFNVITLDTGGIGQDSLLLGFHVVVVRMDQTPIQFAKGSLYFDYREQLENNYAVMCPEGSKYWQGLKTTKPKRYDLATTGKLKLSDGLGKITAILNNATYWTINPILEVANIAHKCKALGQPSPLNIEKRRCITSALSLYNAIHGSAYPSIEAVMGKESRDAETAAQLNLWRAVGLYKILGGAA